jgi:hypothetical protein
LFTPNTSVVPEMSMTSAEIDVVMIEQTANAMMPVEMRAIRGSSQRDPVDGFKNVVSRGGESERTARRRYLPVSRRSSAKIPAEEKGPEPDNVDDATAIELRGSFDTRARQPGPYQL